MRAAGVGEIPVIVGGTVPGGDAKSLLDQGVAPVFTPKDFDLTTVMSRLVAVLEPLTA